MSALKRKADGSGIVVSVRITLNYGVDDDLIRLIESAPPRRMAARIREAMRSGVSTETAGGEEEEELDLSGLGWEL
jgi:hypothetical protein